MFVCVCEGEEREGGKKGGRNVLDNRVKRASEILLFCVVQKWCVLVVQQKRRMEDGRLEEFKTRKYFCVFTLIFCLPNLCL